MKRYFQILGMGLVGGLLLIMLSGRISFKTEPERLARMAQTAPAPAASESTPGEVPLLGKLDEKGLTRVKELERMASEKRQRDEAAKKTHEYRVQVQIYKGAAWKGVLLTNRQKFEALRAQAAQSPDQKVPCAICDGKGVLDPCVVCDRTGKCPTCEGTGKVFDEVCPTCVGTGKCFLCFGLGKMPCPFCLSPDGKEEGAITAGAPDPPMDLPIN